MSKDKAASMEKGRKKIFITDIDSPLGYHIV